MRDDDGDCRFEVGVGRKRGELMMLLCRVVMFCLRSMPPVCCWTISHLYV